MGVALFLLAPLAGAEFEEGVAAASRGDFGEALVLWKPLAEAGRSDAQFEIAELYASGSGVPQDHVQAVRWLSRSAAQGNPQAQYRLGLFYYAGVGVERDTHEALFWVGVAAVQGHEDALRWPDEIEIQLTESETRVLRERILAWRPRSESSAPTLAPKKPGVETKAPPETTKMPAVATKTRPGMTKPGSEPVFLQLGSLRSEEDARIEWQRLRDGHPALLAKFDPTILRADLGPRRGVFHRLRVGPLRDVAEADALCRELTARGVACFTVDPAGGGAGPASPVP